MKAEKMKEKKEEVIYGVENLEELFHRSYVSLFSIRNDYNFPMKSRNGVPSVDLAEWREFAAEYGIDPDHPEKMKSEQLRAAFKLKMIEKSPDITLTGIDAIAHFLHRPIVDVMAWTNNYPDFPAVVPLGSDKWRKTTASTRALRLWLNKYGFALFPAADRMGNEPAGKRWQAE